MGDAPRRANNAILDLVDGEAGARPLVAPLRPAGREPARVRPGRHARHWPITCGMRGCLVKRPASKGGGRCGGRMKLNSQQTAKSLDDRHAMQAQSQRAIQRQHMQSVMHSFRAQPAAAGNAAAPAPAAAGNAAAPALVAAGSAAAALAADAVHAPAPQNGAAAAAAAAPADRAQMRAQLGQIRAAVMRLRAIPTTQFSGTPYFSRAFLTTLSQVRDEIRGRK